MKYIPIFAAAIAMTLTSSAAFAADTARGKALFAQRCAMCHGEKGAGDGALAATMPEGQRPRNLTAGEMKYAKDDAKLTETIKKGGAAVGLSVMMPGQVDLNDSDLASLVAYVKSLKK
jgi:mono/diheme cytochrome c family protein